MGILAGEVKNMMTDTQRGKGGWGWRLKESCIERWGEKKKPARNTETIGMKQIQTDRGRGNERQTETEAVADKQSLADRHTHRDRNREATDR